MAKPIPAVEPVTRASFPASPRSMGKRCYDGAGRFAGVERGARSPPPVPRRGSSSPSPLEIENEPRSYDRRILPQTTLLRAIRLFRRQEQIPRKRVRPGIVVRKVMEDRIDE